MGFGDDFDIRRYGPIRPFVEWGFWIAATVINATANTQIVLMEYARRGDEMVPWHPAAWEWTSNLVLLAMVPAFAWWLDRHPLTWRDAGRSWRWHLLGSVVFCLVHVTAMVWARKGVYALAGEHYDFGDWPRELGYEYLKDFRTYLNWLVIVSAYRFVLLRLQGEASLVEQADDATPEPESEPEPAPGAAVTARPTDRFLVRKLGKEFLVDARDIEWLQASGNYVNLRVRGRDYPLRSTINGIESHLDRDRFVRVHRSYIVNLDRLTEIEVLDTGDARLKMDDGTQVPCSRTYRAGLKQRFGGPERAA